MRRLVALVALTTLALAWLVGGVATAAEDLTAMTNADRASNGQPALTTASDLQSLAQRRAEEMAAARQLSHTQDLGKQVGNWRKLGENVGRGKVLSEIQQSYMASPPHRENILSPDFTQIGVGMATGGEHIYTAVIFRLPANSAPPTTATTATTAPLAKLKAARQAPAPAQTAAAPAPAPAPAPTTTAPPPEPPAAPPATEPAPVAAPEPVPVETAPPTTSPVPVIAELTVFPTADPAAQDAGAVAQVPGSSDRVPGLLAVGGVASLVGTCLLFGAVMRQRRVEASPSRILGG